MPDSVYAQAAAALSRAEALVITAGAGMGVDSGLPDFRGSQGFWNAYPLYERCGLSFAQAANAELFEYDPLFAWGFYAHRLNLYRSTVPHMGFDLLQDWARRYLQECFVVTSNVDGQFQRAGFDPEQVWEIHGSIHHLQCSACCTEAIWDNNAEFAVDHATMRVAMVPQCPRCGRVARPNILMFRDYAWMYQRSRAQEERFEAFMQRHSSSCVAVIEIGAGSAIPTIRNLSEKLGRLDNATVVRINPWEAHIPAPHISLSSGACAALQGLDRYLGRG